MQQNLTSEPIERRLAELVLGVHQRNGGALTQLDLSLRLLDPALRIDSLDLAEIMVAVERELGVSPFDAPVPPRTWGEVARLVRGQKAEVGRQRSGGRGRRSEVRGQEAADNCREATGPEKEPG